jgi:hypothetical protein
MRYVAIPSAWALRTGSVFLAISGDRAASDYRAMPQFLVEIHMADAEQRELARAMGMLEAAQARSPGAGKVAPTIIAGLSREDGRLVCLIEATSLESARRLVSVALLPAGRIREITPVTGRRLLAARHPGGNVDPGVESELVEDVVDVGLDRALGQE